MPAAGRRDAAKERFWRDTPDAFATSGLTVLAFCRDRGLSEKRFYTSRAALARRDRPAPDDTPAVTFVPVRVLPDPATDIFLPSGVALRVPFLADPDAVARLAAARVWVCVQPIDARKNFDALAGVVAAATPPRVIDVSSGTDSATA